MLAPGYLSTSSSISIHALREEGDKRTSSGGNSVPNFYPRPPRGGRLYSTSTRNVKNEFLSTPSARRATGFGEGLIQHGGISIHALREEGDRRRPRQRPVGRISIHALREEGDLPGIAVGGELTGFLSTPSARRATH